MTNPRFKPYIGVTGFKTAGQVTQLSNYVNSLPFAYVMFGITCSDKRLKDPTSEGKVSPSLQNLGVLLDAVHVNHLPMVHYYTSTPENLYDELMALFDYQRKNGLERDFGLQLNQVWPDPEVVLAFANKIPATTLQLPRDVLLGSDDYILDRLRAYEHCVSHVLIDPSGGKGLERQDSHCNFERCSALLLKISKEFPLISPGIAGGFSADNVAQRIKRIREASKCSHCDTPRLDMFTIDAQGRLRTEERISSAYPGDGSEIKKTHLNVDFAKEYIYNALEAFFEE